MLNYGILFYVKRDYIILWVLSLAHFYFLHMIIENLLKGGDVTMFKKFLLLVFLAMSLMLIIFFRPNIDNRLTYTWTNLQGTWVKYENNCEDDAHYVIEMIFFEDSAGDKLGQLTIKSLDPKRIYPLNVYLQITSTLPTITIYIDDRILYEKKHITIMEGVLKIGYETYYQKNSIIWEELINNNSSCNSRNNLD